MKRVVLHDIRSHYNVGAIFRTADGAGVARVYLSGYTPRPLDRFGRVVPEIHKTALGAESMIPWEGIEDLPTLVAALQKTGACVVAVEQSKTATMLADFIVPADVVYILGSETEGLPETVLAIVDEVLELPMLGQKESLNVSVTAGIVLYHT